MNWELEREGVINSFTKMLRAVTGDGSKKRQAGEKPPWWNDDSHEGAIFSHITKWKRGEKVDKDSGAHPLVHAAWRALAIAYQETYGRVDPVSDSDATGYKEDVASAASVAAPVAGVGGVVNPTISTQGLEGGGTPYRVQVYHASPRVRDLHEHGLRG